MEPDFDPYDDPYDSPCKSRKQVYFIFALAAVIAIAALVIWKVKSREIRDREPQSQAKEVPGDMQTKKPSDEDEVDPGSAIADRPGQGDKDLDPQNFSGDPAALMKQLTQALNQQDMEQVDALSGGGMDAKSLEALRQFAAKYQAKGQRLKSREVGETGIDQGRRWAVEADGAINAERVYFDLVQGPDGWVVKRVILPGETPEGMTGMDALATAEAFLLAVLNQNFAQARRFTDGGRVSDARIAGLCILFEEGEYQLREQKPLRVLLMREDFAAYIANVVTTNGSPAGQFGLNLASDGDPARWKVSEINLDKLLADYAQRVAGGDVHYSPLVRNPEGGDTLALYFGFDEDEINPRTRRQLEMVAAILKADPVKKLTLSGHTDSKGTDAYNKQLSLRRAEAVKGFLLDAGVEAAQIETLARGDSEPRRPNVTETGQDNPEGRRVNRRTEIYLDF